MIDIRYFFSRKTNNFVISNAKCQFYLPKTPRDDDPVMLLSLCCAGLLGVSKGVIINEATPNMLEVASTLLLEISSYCYTRIHKLQT